jgi:hypothetical protein
MAGSLIEEFNEILKSLDGLSEDKVQLFILKIVHLFKKIHFNSEFGTEKEKKEAFDFAAQIPNSFSKLRTKLDKNPAIDPSQFKNLFTFLEEDIEGLAERKLKSSIHIQKKEPKGRRKKKDIKKV